MTTTPMTAIPRPLKYRSKTLNELMRKTTPQNIDELAAAITAMDTPGQPLVVRLSISVNLEALRLRRDQYVRCGVLEANTKWSQPATPRIENKKGR